MTIKRLAVVLALCTAIGLQAEPLLQRITLNNGYVAEVVFPDLQALDRQVNAEVYFVYNNAVVGTNTFACTAPIWSSAVPRIKADLEKKIRRAHVKQLPQSGTRIIQAVDTPACRYFVKEKPERYDLFVENCATKEKANSIVPKEKSGESKPNFLALAHKHLGIKATDGNPADQNVGSSEQTHSKTSLSNYVKYAVYAAVAAVGSGILYMLLKKVWKSTPPAQQNVLQTTPPQAPPATTASVPVTIPALPAAYQCCTTKIVVKAGDITGENAQAIVNAANVHLAHGGGVAAAIERAASSSQKRISFQEDCYQLPMKASGLLKDVTTGAPMNVRCDVGSAVVTKSGALKDKGIQYVIHTVGPDCRDALQSSQKETLLYNAYYQSLVQAQAQGVQTIAFPAISTEIFGYNVERATPVAMHAIKNYLTNNPGVFEEIRLILYPNPNQDEFNKYRKAYAQACQQEFGALAPSNQ